MLVLQIVRSSRVADRISITARPVRPGIGYDVATSSRNARTFWLFAIAKLNFSRLVPIAGGLGRLRPKPVRVVPRWRREPTKGSALRSKGEAEGR